MRREPHSNLAHIARLPAQAKTTSFPPAKRPAQPRQQKPKYYHHKRDRSTALRDLMQTRPEPVPTSPTNRWAGTDTTNPSPHVRSLSPHAPPPRLLLPVHPRCLFPLLSNGQRTQTFPKTPREPTSGRRSLSPSSALGRQTPSIPPSFPSLGRTSRGQRRKLTRGEPLYSTELAEGGRRGGLSLSDKYPVRQARGQAAWFQSGHHVPSRVNRRHENPCTEYKIHVGNTMNACPPHGLGTLREKGTCEQAFRHDSSHIIAHVASLTCSP